MGKGSILTKDYGAVREIIISTPGKRNAIASVMMDDLVDAITAARRDKGVRVVVLAGEGDCFSSGGDLSQSLWDGLGTGVEASRFRMEKYGDAIRALAGLDKPTIAMVDGFAVGGGFALAMACDLVYVSTRCKLSCNFLKIGLPLEMGTFVMLPQLVGMRRAKELMLSGRFVKAEEAVEIGLANAAFSPEELHESVLKKAEEIASLPQESASIAKTAMNAMNYSMLDTCLAFEAQSSPFCALTEDFKTLTSKFRK